MTSLFWNDPIFKGSWRLQVQKKETVLILTSLLENLAEVREIGLRSGMYLAKDASAKGAKLSRKAGTPSELPSEQASKQASKQTKAHKNNQNQTKTNNTITITKADKQTN